MERPVPAKGRFHALYDAGFNVIPLLHRDKKAAIKWREFQERRATPEEVVAWSTDTASFNVGVVTGQTSGDRVFLDIDSEDARQRLEATYGPLPVTPTVRTGKGWHLCLHDASGQLRNFVGKVKDVDLRANGGYVVGVGSLHPSGGLYKWMPGLSPADVLIAEVPRWLWDLADGDDSPGTTSSPVPVKPPPPMRTGGASRAVLYAERALAYEVERIRSVKPGTRNHALNRSAFSLGQLVGAGVLARDSVEQILLDACRQNSLINDDGERSVWDTIRSGLEAGLAVPRDLANVCGRDRWGRVRVDHG